MEMMAKAGMTPMQVLVAATGGAARVTKVDSKIGTIDPGKYHVAGDMVTPFLR